MIYDCHLHIGFSGDSNTSISLQIEKAIEFGMKEIYITDHHDYDSGFCGCGFILNIPAHLTALHTLQTDYRDCIRINIGIELGLQKHLKQYLEHFVKRYGDSFDFIIGPGYFVKSMDPYDPEYWDSQGEVTGFEDFFEASLVRVRGLCHVSDSFGRLDYTVRYAPHQDDFYDCRHLSQWISPFLRILIENGKSLERNAGGFGYGLGQPNPCREISVRYRELGNEMVTIGSDVHTSEHVGYASDTYCELLLDCGYKYFIMYHDRKPELAPLQPGNG